MHFSSRQAYIAFTAAAVNLAASAAMLFWLAPATAAGGALETRLAYIASHTLRVQIGWSIWIAASISLVLLFYALSFDEKGAPDFWNTFAALTALLGGASDTLADLISLGILPHLAAAWQNSVEAQKLFLVSQFELWDRFTVLCTGGLGNTFYGLAGTILTINAFHRRRFSSIIRTLSIPLWLCTFLMSYGSFTLDTHLLPYAVGSTMALFVIWSFLIGMYFCRKGET